MIAVQALKDDSSHWYIVPNDEVDEFKSLLDKAEQGDFEAEDEFISKFSKYMTGGDLNNVQLYIKQEDV